MTAPDLTPAEARAEVEAFMGEGWRFMAYEYEAHDGARPVPCVYCEQLHVDGIELRFTGPTYRAAVDALKQAWRDAVRPWIAQAREEGRREEREACAVVLDEKEAACMDLALREPECAQKAWAAAAQWRSGALAIRARGED